MPYLVIHIDWLQLLSGLATVGIPTALLLYSVKKMRALAGPHAELEPQHIVNIMLAFPTTQESLQSLEILVRRADFRSPETRRDELRKLKSWLADHDLSVGDGCSAVLRQSLTNPGLAGPGAERLAEAQIRRLEIPPQTVSPRLGETSWCVLSLAAAIAASAAETLPEGNGIEAATGAHDALKAATEAFVAMDAFYLFYSPAPGETLSPTDAHRLVQDLQALQKS